MSYLTTILEDMLIEAKAKNVSKRRLKNGLMIKLVIMPTKVIITLGRQICAPSIQEWDTVMKHFPYNTPKIIPTPTMFGDVFTITGAVPTQHIMQMKFG